MKQTDRTSLSNSAIINGIAVFFMIALFIASYHAATYSYEAGRVFHDWYTIMITPCPLVTDYLEVGGLSSAFLNAGACSLVCVMFMIGLKGESHANTLAGYFLVIAHCFYGLNLLTMLPCFLAPFIYLRCHKLDFKNNLHICMFTTSFGPFISEFLFRYTQQEEYVFGEVRLTAAGIALAAGFVIMLGFIVPAILPGAHAWHKGYNLYNGGLAFGIFGFFLYNFLYKTMEVAPPVPVEHFNVVYEYFDRSFDMFANRFFFIVFPLCIYVGYVLDGRSFENYNRLICDTGHRSDFAANYGMPACLVNIGWVGLMFVFYLNLIMMFTEGAGYTGPTIGVVLAALTFTAMGQHPKNIWPILAGYLLLYLAAMLLCRLTGREIGWTISTQAYINGAAFATGLCPIVGHYGIRAGAAAGFLCASMCTATSALHGGLVLYNGGFTAGITALILLPILEHYISEKRGEVKYPPFMKVSSMIALVEQISGGAQKQAKGKAQNASGQPEPSVQQESPEEKA